MDVVGLTSSFLTVIGFGIQLYKDVKAFSDDTKGSCPSEIRKILVEVGSLNATLQTVVDLVNGVDTSPEEDARLTRQFGGPIDGCRDCIDGLKKLLSSTQMDLVANPSKKASPKQKAKLFLDAVKWAGSRKEKCEALLSSLAVHKHSLNLGLTALCSGDIKQIGADVREVKRDVKHVKSTVNTMQAQLDESAQDKVFEWLESHTTNPSSNNNDAEKLYDSTTCSWLTRSGEWNTWLLDDSQSRFLWINGYAGAGKTILAYSMIKHLRRLTGPFNESPNAQRKDCSYYYCYHGRNEDAAVPFLAWIVRRFCMTSRSVPFILNNMYRHKETPTTLKLLDCLDAILTQFAETYVVVDAVDESKPCKGLVDVLKTLGTDPRFGKLRVAVTSRRYAEIADVFQKHAIVVSMDQHPGVQADIQMYIKNMLGGEDYKKWDEWKPGLKETVGSAVLKSAKGMFRYAACQLQILHTCYSLKDLGERLNNLPDGIDATYAGILRAINDNKNRELVLRALVLVMGAENDVSPIHSDTLAEGVFGPGSCHDIEKLKQYCLCLIQVRADKTVVLAHYTVREFLQSLASKIESGTFDGDGKLKFFALNAKTVAGRYNSIIVSTAAASKFSGSRGSVKDDPNGNPIGFDPYALSRTRMAIFWDRTHTLQTHGSDRLISLLNPFGASSHGLRLFGSDGHKDSGNYVMFEWLVQYMTSNDTCAQRAAHLAMIVSLEEPDVVNKFLQKIEDPATVFAAKINAKLPMDFNAYYSNGAMESNPTAWTVLGLYVEGKRRGYFTDPKIAMLRKFFGKYLPESEVNSSIKLDTTRTSHEAAYRCPLSSTRTSSTSRSSKPQGSSLAQAPSQKGPPAPTPQTASTKAASTQKGPPPAPAPQTAPAKVASTQKGPPPVPTSQSRPPPAGPKKQEKPHVSSAQNQTAGTSGRASGKQEPGQQLPNKR